jgi:hypothetical protein
MQDYWAVRQKLYIQSAGPSLSQPREQLPFWKIQPLRRGSNFAGIEATFWTSSVTPALERLEALAYTVAPILYPNQ